MMRDHNPSTSDSEHEPFRPSEKGLLVTLGSVNGVPALVVIDTGADINHISTDFCKRARICTAAAPYKAQLAKKSSEDLRVTKNKVAISLGSYIGSSLVAAYTLNYDVILGKRWCAKHKAKIDCAKNIITILHGRKSLTIKAVHDSGSDISFNAVQLKDSTAQIFTISIKPPVNALDPSMSKDIRTLVQEYCRIFQKQLSHLAGVGW